MIITINHITDGLLISRNAEYIPKTGDLIKLNKTEYIVIKVIWDINSMKNVTLIVKDIEY